MAEDSTMPNPHISAEERSRLTRSIHELPPFIEEALHGAGLVDTYLERPAYQKNDYIGWITGAKREATRQKRLTQMLDELQAGDRYMKMVHSPSIE